jgi:hypothetical protein
MIVQIARSRWERHVKSFLQDQTIAIKYETLHGMLTSAVREKGLSRHIGNDGFEKTLKDHGVQVGYVQPPAGWGTSVSVRCCLFPLQVLQAQPKTLPSLPAKEESAPPQSRPEAKPGSAPSPQPPSGAIPAKTFGIELDAIEDHLVAFASELRNAGKVVQDQGDDCILVEDLRGAFPDTHMDGAKIETLLKILEFELRWYWVKSERRRVKVVAIWKPHGLL